MKTRDRAAAVWFQSSCPWHWGEASRGESPLQLEADREPPEALLAPHRVEPSTQGNVALSRQKHFLIRKILTVR